MNNFIISEKQLKLIIDNQMIIETTKKNNKVECKCGHSWDLSDGGKDPYICHECGRDNEKKKDETAKYIKCRNCNKKFTQTIYKNKKSTPVCPTCGTLNKD